MGSKDGMAKIHYLRAWPILLYSTVAYFMTSTVAGALNVASGVYGQTYGWDPYLITSMISVASFFNFLLGLLAGRLCVRYSPKKLCMVYGILYILGILAMGFSPQFGLFVVGMVVANAASSAVGMNTVPVLITNWFPTRKGTVQGAVSMGIPLGNAVAAMLFNWAYQRFGLDFGFLPFVVICGLSLALLIAGISDYPENRGFEPDTMERVPKQEGRVVRQVGSSEGEPASMGMSDFERGLLRNPRFVVLSVVLASQLVFAGGIMVQVVPKLMQDGYTVDAAVGLMLATALFACLGSFICGIVGDRMGAKTGVVLSFVIGAVAMVLGVMPSHAATFASIALVGIVVGSADNWPVNLCAERYGREGFSRAFSIMLPVIQLVGAIGPSFFALIAANFGGYDVAYLAAGVMMVVCLALFLLLWGKDGAAMEPREKTQS